MYLLRAECRDGNREHSHLSVGECVVGADRLDLVDAAPFDVGGGRGQEPCRDGAFLIGVDLGISEAGAVIDGGVDEVEPDPVLPVVGACRATMDAPAAAVGDAAQFVHIDMDQFARPVAFLPLPP